MKKIELLRTVIFVLAAIAMFLAVTHSVFGIDMLPIMLICGVAFCLSCKFDKWDWLGWPCLPMFLYGGAIVGLLVGLPVFFFSMK